MTRREACTRCGQTHLNEFWTAWDRQCSTCQDMAYDEARDEADRREWNQ